MKKTAVIKGKVTLTGNVPPDLDCTYSLNYLIRREPSIAPQPEIANLGFDIRKGWQPTWLETLEGRAYLATMQQWFCQACGRWCIPDQRGAARRV
jgi:hypothetical protein